MKYINLANNRFRSFGVLFAKWAIKDDTHVNVKGNPIEVVIFREFSGTIPDFLFQLSDSLLVVDLEVNQKLVGTIPTQIGLLTNLIDWKSYETKLTGTLPSELGNLLKLEKLDIADCYFTGDVPSQLGKLSMLEHITLDSNRFSGTFPQQIFKLSSLIDVHLHRNPNLTGHLAFNNTFPYLEDLQIHDTSFSGTVPRKIGSLKS